MITNLKNGARDERGSLFPKCQNGWTDRAQMLCGTSQDPSGHLWLIKISKNSLKLNSIFQKFSKKYLTFCKFEH